MSTLVFENLISQIDSFIRKYYKNQMIKGIIWFLGILLFTFLIITILEYFGRFNSLVRAFLFFSFISINLIVFIQFILIPLLKLFSFSSRITHVQASQIIGQFFPEVSDRLLNTLQLNTDLSNQNGNIELLRASVQQKAAQLSVIPFSDAIDISKNWKYFKWVLPLFFIFLTIAIVSPTVFTDGTKRVVNYSTTYVPEAPFKFLVDEYPSQLAEGSDLVVNLNLVGSDIPQKVYIISSQGKHLMNVSGRNQFSFKLPKLYENGSFYFIANDFSSKSFSYSIIGRPFIGDFKAEITYPKYLGKLPTSLNNAGDLFIPEGSVVNWSISTKNTSTIDLAVNSTHFSSRSNGLKCATKFNNSSPFYLKLKGSYGNLVDSLNFMVHVQKDAFPIIQVEEQIDSVSRGLRFFNGVIKDDYGLTSLKFVYTITSKDKSKRTETLPVQPVSGIDFKFQFAVDFLRESIQLDDQVDYYFVVSDNDGVNGSKSSRSQTFTLKLPSLSELNDERSDLQNQSKSELLKLKDQSQDLMKKLDHLQKDLLNSKTTDWKQKNQLNSIKQEYNDILNQLESLNKSLKNSSEEVEKLSNKDIEFLEKQQMIEDLMNQLMDKELLDLLNKFEKLLDQNNKEKQKESLDELKLSSEEMNKRLDRSLEILKKMQVDEKIDAIENELKQLALEQKELQKKTESNSLSKDELLKQQQDINDKFNQLKDDLKELNKLNSELEKPLDLPSTLESEESIQNDLNNSSDQISKEKNSKAGKSQQSAGEKMEQLAEQMDKAQADANQQQQEEDIDSLRNILSSLIRLSLDQEQLMNEFSSISSNDPKYRTLAKNQRLISSNTKIISDSLYALAKRQPALAKFVDDELMKIQTNLDKTKYFVSDRNMRFSSQHQHLTMTSFNNLALMLNKSLQQMQQQMQAMMNSSGSCQNPNGKGMPKPGAGEGMSSMKERLRKQLEQMQKGSNPDGDKPGEQPGKSSNSQGGGFGNKEFAKMAAEQNAIRQKLEQLKNQLNKDGKGEGNQLNPLLKELEKQESDLIEKRFSPELIKRQQDILTRLLESEKAIREREFDNKRESNEAKNTFNSNLIRFDEYNKEKLKQIELLKVVDPVYNKYYKDKAHQFFNLSR